MSTVTPFFIFSVYCQVMLVTRPRCRWMAIRLNAKRVLKEKVQIFQIPVPKQETLVHKNLGLFNSKSYLDKYTIQDKWASGGNGNDGLLCIPQSSSITRTSYISKGILYDQNRYHYIVLITKIFRNKISIWIPTKISSKLLLYCILKFKTMVGAKK